MDLSRFGLHVFRNTDLDPFDLQENFRNGERNSLDIRNIFDIELTSFSTFILLASSLFMALAVSAIHKGNLKSTRWMLFGTIVFGAIFLACQVYEFTHFVYHEGHELTLSTYQGEPMSLVNFYVLTGTHGTHVAIGVFGFSMARLLFTGRMSTADAMDIECCGLYWHFVDIVWIIIFPVVYLMDTHSDNFNSIPKTTKP